MRFLHAVCVMMIITSDLGIKSPVYCYGSSYMILRSMRWEGRYQKASLGLLGTSWGLVITVNMLAINIEAAQNNQAKLKDFIDKRLSSGNPRREMD